ncbi:MAG: peptidoglycan editing factor PgeF [Burkholderiales bacterium]|nr:peptidoglycan editing factor PgeF [Burkholderiales bacterium]
MSSVHGLPFPVIIPDWQGVPAHVHAFCTTRRGGFSAAPYDDGCGGGGFNLGDHVADDVVAVAANRTLLNRCLPTDVIFLSQVHGNIVVDAATIHQSVTADAVFTDRGAAVCAVLTADCLPVLFSDRSGHVVAAAHAGWRGLAGGVLQNTVAQMQKKGADEIVAWMGPAIGPAQFEVGQEVLDVFTAQMANAAECFVAKTAVGRTAKYNADIYGLAGRILAAAGVTQVYGGRHCTVTETGQFYSYRRDGVTGRMASLIWIG